MRNLTLRKEYLEELESLKDQIPTPDRFRWLESIGKEEYPDYIKVRTARGYLMGLRDCGKNIGDLKLLLEKISLDEIN